MNVAAPQDTFWSSPDFKSLGKFRRQCFNHSRPTLQRFQRKSCTAKIKKKLSVTCASPRLATHRLHCPRVEKDVTSLSLSVSESAVGSEPKSSLAKVSIRSCCLIGWLLHVVVAVSC